MQDKPSIDYQALAEKGWQSMQRQLDKEMPVQNRRKPLGWILWLSAACVTGLGTWMLLAGNAAQQTDFAGKNPAGSYEASTLERGDAPAMSAADKSAGHLELANEDLAEAETMHSKTARAAIRIPGTISLQPSASSSAAVNASGSDHMLAEYGTAPDLPGGGHGANAALSLGAGSLATSTAIALDGEGLELSASANEEPAGLVPAERGKITDLDQLETQSPQALALENADAGIIHPEYLPDTRKRPWTISLAGLYNFPSVSSGASLGIQHHVLQMGKKWSASAGAGVEYLPVRQVFVTDLVKGETEVTNSFDQHESLSSSNGTIGQSKLTGLLAVRAHAQLAYRISPRLSGYAAVSPGLIFSSTKEVNNSYYTPGTQAGLGNQAAALTRSWDIVGALGIEYRISKFLGVSVAYRYGLTPYIENISDSKPGRANQVQAGLLLKF